MMKSIAAANRLNFRLLAGTALAGILTVAAHAQAPTPSPDPSAQAAAVTPATSGEIAGQTIQDDAAAAPASPAGIAAPADNGEVVVTGSRIARAGFSSPTPVTAVSSSQLAASSPSTIAAALNNLPSLSAQGGPQANAGSLSGGQNFLNLRGLGQTRTLVLLDGHRFPTSSTTNTVDTNLLPSGLVDRVEVVTGGASAAYGSDAVAGVVNFILKKKLHGVEGNASYGISQHGDNKEVHATLNAGTSFADGRGEFISSFEYYDSKGVAGDARASRLSGAGIINNPTGSPVRIVRYDTRNFGTYGGVVTAAKGGTAAANAAFVGTQFFSDGTYGPYDYGTLATSTTQVGGDGLNTAVMQEIARPLSRMIGFARATYDLTDKVQAFVEGTFAYSHTNYIVGVPFQNGSNGLVINRDNAYLPAALSARMTAAGVTSLTVNRYFDEFTYTNNNKNWTYLGLGGFRGDLGKLHWEATYQLGGNKFDSFIANDILVGNLKNAVDAVASPTTGQIVCRVALTNPSTNCVPFNALGSNRASDAAIDYVTDTGGSITHTREQVADLTVNGDLFNNWAGAVSIATGVEYRTTKVWVDADAQSNAGLFNFGNPISWRGKYDIIEGFLETDVPLAKDLSWAKALDLNAAVRETHYSTSGSVTTWKVGLVYQPIADLKFRATRSRDIRAPNLSELFSPGRTATQTITDPLNNNNRYAGIKVLSGGNPSLKPEIADTTVLGVVAEPRFIPRFSLSVDYYRIHIAHAISALGYQDVVDRCAQGATDLCQYVIRDSNNLVTQIFAPTYGIQTLRANGIDIEALYRLPLSNVAASLPGTLTFRNLASFQHTLKTITPGATIFNSAGAGNFPRWRVTSAINYDQGPLSVYLQGRFLSAKLTDVTYTVPNAIDDNHVAAQFYLDGQITYGVAKGIDAYLNVQNILNHKPPVDPQTGNYFVPTNPNLYDQIGRMFRVGVKFKF